MLTWYAADGVWRARTCACACADWVTWTTNLRCRSLLLTSLDSRLFISGNALAYFQCYILSSNCLKYSHGQNLKESNTNNFLKINTISSTMLNICGLTCMVSEDVHVKTRVRSMSDVSRRCRMLSTTAAASTQQSFPSCTDRGSSSRVTKGQRISSRCDVYLPKSCFWFTTYICEAYLAEGLFKLLKKKEKKRCKINVARSAGSSGNEVQILALFHCFRYRQEQPEHYFPSHVSSSWSPWITDKCLAVS